MIIKPTQNKNPTNKVIFVLNFGKGQGKGVCRG